MSNKKRGRSPLHVSVIPKGGKDHPHLKRFEDYMAEHREKSLRARLLDDLWRDPASPAFAGALAYQVRGGHIYRTGIALGFTPQEQRWQPTTVDALGHLGNLAVATGGHLIGALMDHAERTEGEWENFNIVQPIHPLTRLFGPREETFKGSIERLEEMGAKVNMPLDPAYTRELDAKLRQHAVVLLSFGPHTSKVILQNYRDDLARDAEAKAKVARRATMGEATMLDAIWEIEAGVDFNLPPQTYLRLRRTPK